MAKKLTVIIPTFNEASFIEQCLVSVAKNDYPKRFLEVFVVDGMSRDGTREIVRKYSRQYKYLKLLDNPQRFVPHALNIGIEQSSGEYIIRIDAHSKFPINYFSWLVEWHEKLQADNVGAGCVTDVIHKTGKANAIKKVLSDPLGVGNSYFRTGVNKLTQVDTVPFGCYKKETFNKYGLFDERLIRNQDIEFNKRIIKGGGKIYLLPDLECTYYTDESYTRLAKKNYKNGLWNVLTAYFTKSFSSLGLRHFIPLIFLLSLALPLPFLFVTPYVLLVTGLSLTSYLLVISIKSLLLSEKKTCFTHLFACFVVLHFSYGFGSFLGLFAVLAACIFKKNKTNQHPA